MGASLKDTAAWRHLSDYARGQKTMGLSDIVGSDLQRLDQCEIAVDGLRLNYAFQGVTPTIMNGLIKLAEQQKVIECRAQLFGGDKINTTEKRAVLHTALRQKTGAKIQIDGRNIQDDIKAVRQKMATFSTDVRQGRWKGATGKTIKHIVNIGIGGSDLGPRLVVEALAPYATGPQLHFVANADAFDLLSVLARLDPAETLFVVVSKTFTTQETLLNATSARAWLVKKLGEKAVTQHFVAVSTHGAAVEKFGIEAANMFPMWDWVGGRFSLWSAVGLSITLALGMENFDKLCDGAAALDQHFLTAPLAHNMPVILALLGVWHRNFLEAPALAILPYSERLRNLPRFLQQLDMESNGKSVTHDGEATDYETAPIIFGECGTVGQHSFHQWLHQGSTRVPADFIGVATDDQGSPEHHRIVLANMVAQAGALAWGQSNGKTPQDQYAGHRSSNFILLDRLDPYHLGMLIALYEHKIFVQGVIWNINSFDQPGVELGKKLARTLETPSSTPQPSEAFLGAFLRRVGLNSKK